MTVGVERAIIISGMVCAIISYLLVPGAFMWGLYFGARRHRRT